MQLLAICFIMWLSWMNAFTGSSTEHEKTNKEGNETAGIPTTSSLNPAVCNCSITQAGATYPISALIGTENSVAFYDYGNPTGSSANTGLELGNALILFLYEDINTGLISLFLIADIQNDGSGGTMSFEANCVPTDAYISVQDDPGEFSGAPPLITGNWNWQACCTDGGVIENIGCNNSMNLDLLVSSGIDSIVWLTGDIANPAHILLSLDGEAITINCGGNVCCPVGLDTEISITDATCPLNADGSITLDPQDGIAPYTYNWSNNATTATNSDLPPGTYLVTVTDALGCTEELSINVVSDNPTPVATPATLNLCSDLSPDEFDLTTVDDIVNGGTGLNVLWFENMDLSNPILFPETYTVSGGTVYAVVDNGFCTSPPVPVMLTITPLPVATETFLEECEEEPGWATFDLTALENTISGGIGQVLWYLSNNFTNPILDPEEFYSQSQEIYAYVYDGICTSAVANIMLIVLPLPEGETVDFNVCGDPAEEYVFDLTSIETAISGGINNVSWYLENDLIDPIPFPNAYMSGTNTVYAVLFDGLCYSDPIPIDLIILPVPMGNTLTVTVCADGSGEATINLYDYDAPVSGGSGAVDWYADMDLLQPISNPSNFVTGSTIVYAAIDNGTCVSLPVPVTLNVISDASGNPTTIESCGDVSGEGIFNLTASDSIVSGGTGTVTWYTDSLGQNIISLADTYMSGDTTVYAQVQNGLCISDFIPVELNIVSSVFAQPTTSLVCEFGNDMAIFDLVQLSVPVSGGIGEVHWYLDAFGTMPIMTTSTYLSGNTIIYAQTILGTCVSAITPITLSVLPGPDVMPLSLELCGDDAGMGLLDLTALQSLVSPGGGIFTWYVDAALTTLVTNPSGVMTGDTIFYATVFDNICLSPPVAVNIVVSPALYATPQTISECKLAGEVLLYDLTALETAISGGVGLVMWFTDAAGTNVLTPVNAFPVIATTTVYALVTNGICTTALVPIQIDITDEPIAIPIDIQRCGDPQGEFMIDLTSLDTLISEHTGSVTWYVDSMLNNLIVNPFAFQTGDTTLYVIVTNGICVSEVVPITLSVVDTLSANSITIDICVVQDETVALDLSAYDIQINGGSGNVQWFTDQAGTNPVINTTTFVTIGDTLYASFESGGCISDLAMISILATHAMPPEALCAYTGQDSIAISWTDVTDLYEVSYSINGISAGNPVSTGLPGFNLGGLQNNDTLTVIVAAVYSGVCTVELSDTVTCITEACPDLTLGILQPGILCEADDPIQLQLLVEGLPYADPVTWSGEGMVTPNGLFNPASAMAGDHTIQAIIARGGCVYMTEDVIRVTLSPISSFTLDGSPCRDSTLLILFNGYAFLGGSDWNWDFDDGIATKIDPPLEDYYITWSDPGMYEVRLWLDHQGCYSDTFFVPVEIRAPAEGPVLHCVEESQTSVRIEWDDIPGATSIEAFSSNGHGTLSGNTYSIENLPGDSTVTITVVANGPTLCGPVESTIGCRTLPLPSKSYIPNIFSPNGDGINDFFFIQSNGQLEKVNAMRIFDRWGDLVFEKIQFLPDDPLSGWDGSFGGKEMNPGVYLYWVEFETNAGEVVTLVGDVTLLR